MAGTNRDVPPIDATLKRIVVAYRVLALFWLAALVGSTLATDPGADRSIVVATLVVATIMTIALVVVSGDRERLVSWPMLAIDGAAATFIGLSAGLADSIDLYAQQPALSGRVRLGRLTLSEGKNNLMIKLVGQNEKSTGLGLDLINIICRRE